MLLMPALLSVIGSDGLLAGYCQNDNPRKAPHRLINPNDQHDGRKNTSLQDFRGLEGIVRLDGQLTAELLTGVREIGYKGL